jgi:epoxide hydrolase-like predicted phosphatase
MIKAVIFDWGGVVAANPNGGWLNQLADMLNMTVEDLLPHWRAAGYSDFSKGLIDEETFWRQFEVSLGRPLPQDVSSIWVDGSALRPWPEMLAFVEELKNSGIRTAILSNTVRPMSIRAKESGIYADFHPVILSDEVGLVKPDMQIYQLTLDELGLSASECIYVDDLQKNLDPAADLGMTTVLASNEVEQTIADIRSAMC